MEKCACVVLNYNDHNTTINLLKMIENYHILDYIVVVDNCSTDDSYEVLKQNESERIKCIRSDKNGGYGYGNNYGITYAYNRLNCRYVILSNPDVAFNEEYLIHCLTVIKDRNLACISGIQLDIQGKPIEEMAWKIPTALQYAVMGTRLEKKYNCSYADEELNNQFNYVECLPGAMIIYDAEKFLDAGGYDENMFLYCEETAIAIRLKNKGYKSGLTKEVAYKHEHSASINKSIKSLREQTKIMFKSRNYLMKEYLQSNLFEKIIAGICHTYILYKLNNKVYLK